MVASTTLLATQLDSLYGNDSYLAFIENLETYISSSTSRTAAHHSRKGTASRNDGDKATRNQRITKRDVPDGCTDSSTFAARTEGGVLSPRRGVSPHRRGMGGCTFGWAKYGRSERPWLEPSELPSPAAAWWRRSARSDSSALRKRREERVSVPKPVHG